jgi:AcrR family transcriptional regulator
MVQEGPRRRPLEGGYARGDEKRTKIIEVALRIFGEQGYDSASTRQIAQEAGVNPPALQYYFEGKEGLYFACAEHIFEYLSRATAPARAIADSIGPDASPGAAVDALCNMMDVLADFIFNSVQAEGWSRFIARCQGEDGGSTFRLFKQKVQDQHYSRCFRLVGLAIGRPADDPETKVRTIAIMGQMNTFHLGRHNALEILGWPDLHGERLALVKRVMGMHTRAALGLGLELGA